MIISTGTEHNFAFQMPTRATNMDTFFMVPSSLQMGWKSSPAYFSIAMQTTRELVRHMLALTINTGITEPHRHEHHCQQSPPPQPKPEWQTPTDMTIMSVVFIDDFCNGIAGHPNQPRKGPEQQCVARANLHGIHGIFPSPEVLQHAGGKDSISEKKLEKGDARWKPSEVILGIQTTGGGGTRTPSIHTTRQTS
jgi:hypothetical protein